MKYRLNTNRSKYNDFKSLINLKIMRIIDNYYNNENETIWYNNIKNMKLGIEPKYGRVRSMNYKENIITMIIIIIQKKQILERNQNLTKVNI